MLQACAYHIASRLAEMLQLLWGYLWTSPDSVVISRIKVVMLTTLVSTTVRLSTEQEAVGTICRRHCRQIDIDQRITTVLLVANYVGTSYV